MVVPPIDAEAGWDAADATPEQMRQLIELARDQNILNADQLIALNNIAAAAGIDGYAYQDPTKAAAPAPAFTQEEIDTIYQNWLKTQTGYKPPAPAFGMDAPASSVMMTTQSMATMPRLIDDMPKQGKPINMETMPRIIDVPKPINLEKMPRIISEEELAEARRDSATRDKEWAVLWESIRTEIRALVTTQSRANPEVIAQLQALNERLESLERQQRIKA